MSSLSPNYEYDIFISYRHKDNKYDGWVTEFVNNLKKEIEATFKEDISIYFDVNPHDGLLETHNVDKSLEGKLKCLIFIPIISQTYCDPKSFAWQHEFVAFNKLAKDDQIGRDIKLSNGNVTSRILPVRIHDLDAEDKLLLENELGPLRSIDFIFKSSGVNRPLRANEDHPNDNLNKAYYRDHINKVANAIKEIMAAIKNPVQPAPTTIIQQPTTKSTQNKEPVFITLAILLMVIVGFLIFRQLSTSDQPPTPLDKSIAVLPFTDISEARDQAYFSDGMMIEILDHLFKIKDLRIIPRNSTLGYKDSSKPLKEIASELGVAHLIQGSVRRAGNKVKISVALIDGSTEKYLWHHTYEDDITDVSRIFLVQSDVASQIANALQAQVTQEVKKRLVAIPTQNQEAYDLYLHGRDEFGKYWNDINKDHVHRAIEFYNQSISLDSGFSDAYTGLGQSYAMLGHYPPVYSIEVWQKSKEYLSKAIELDSSNGWAYGELGLVQNKYDWDKDAALQSFQKAAQLDPSNAAVHENFLFFYIYTQNCEEAERELNILKSISPGDYFHFDVWVKMCLGQTDELASMKVPEKLLPLSMAAAFERYLILKQFDNAHLLIEQESQKLNSKMWPLMWQGEVLALFGKKQEAREALRNLTELSKQQYVPKTYFASICFALGEEEKAYEYLNKSLQERDGTALHDAHLLAPLYMRRNDGRLKEFIKRTWEPLEN